MIISNYCPVCEKHQTRNPDGACTHCGEVIATLFKTEVSMTVNELARLLAESDSDIQSEFFSVFTDRVEFHNWCGQSLQIAQSDMFKGRPGEHIAGQVAHMLETLAGHLRESR